MNHLASVKKARQVKQSIAMTSLTEANALSTQVVGLFPRVTLLVLQVLLNVQNSVGSYAVWLRSAKWQTPASLFSTTWV